MYASQPRAGDGDGTVRREHGPVEIDDIDPPPLKPKITTRSLGHTFDENMNCHWCEIAYSEHELNMRVCPKAPDKAWRRERGRATV